MLYTVLLGLMPTGVCEFDSHHLPDFPELLERFGLVWRTEIGQSRLRQDELVKRVAELERELARFQDADWVGRLDQINFGLILQFMVSLSTDHLVKNRELLLS